MTGAAAQPRRLAVLALLARAGRSGVTREKILALLWPDDAEDRARRSLNQAVYSLRRDLGADDALIGTKDLRLNFDLIEVDVAEFQQAFDTNDVDRAVRVYTGPFLDGFFVPRAPDFERWVEAERSALARDYAVALERVATRATRQGDTAGAVTHWRKLAGSDPLNGRVAISVMRALVAAGDVNGAIQHARLYEALLDQELGLPPDSEIAAFARELRVNPGMKPAAGAAPAVAVGAPTHAVQAAVTEPAALLDRLSPPHAAVAPVPARPVAEPSTVDSSRRWWLFGATVAAAALAVAVGFAVWRGRSPSAGASDSRLVVAVGTISDYVAADSSDVGRALRDMLATNLARAREITVISGSRLLEVERQMSRGAPSAPGAIVPVARQAGATTLIDGALYPLGADTLRLDLRVTNLGNGNVLRAYTVTGRDPFDLADSATARLVEYLGASAPRGSVADAMTPSLTAYRLYEEGLRSFYRGELDASARLFDAALAEDSAFAMAAYYSARATRGSRSRYLTRLRRAVALATHASDRERLIIQGGWAEANNSPALASIAETLAVRYPKEVEGHYYLGRALVNGGSFTEAVIPLRRVELMDSLSLHGGDPRCAACDALLQEAVSYELADSMAAAERVIRRWIAARPKSSVAHIELGRLLSAVGRLDEAQEEFRTAAMADPSGSSWEPMTTLWIRSGQFAKADQLLRAEIAKGGSQVEPHWFLAISLRYQGRLSEALGDARAYRRGLAGVERETPGAAEPAALLEAQVLRELGRYRESAALFDSISRFRVAGADSSAITSGGVWSLTHRAGALAAAGDTGLLAALADTIELWGAGSNLARDQRLHHHVRGLLLAARGDDSSAATEFRRAVFSTTFGYTRTNVEMARSLIRLGRYAEATAVLSAALRGSLEAANLYATHSEIRLMLAEAYARAGQRDRATDELEWVQRAWANADPVVRRRLQAVATLVVR